MKTKEIKKEFYEEFAKPFPYGNITDGQFEYIWDSSKPSPDTIWQFIESTISQTRQEVIEEIDKILDRELNTITQDYAEGQLSIITPIKKYLDSLEDLNKK